MRCDDSRDNDKRGDDKLDDNDALARRLITDADERVPYFGETSALPLTARVVLSMRRLHPPRMRRNRSIRIYRFYSYFNGRKPAAKMR
jgi:hypothetical protein